MVRMRTLFLSRWLSELFTIESKLDRGSSDVYSSSLCNAMAQLGMLRTSIFFSSGDGGVAGSQTTQCTNFLPTFPSGCPLYVHHLVKISYMAEMLDTA